MPTEQWTEGQWEDFLNGGLIPAVSVTDAALKLDHILVLIEGKLSRDLPVTPSERKRLQFCRLDLKHQLGMRST